MIYFHVLCHHFWTKNIPSVFDPVTGSMIGMQVLRMNINDDYNNKNTSSGGNYFGGFMV